MSTTRTVGMVIVVVCLLIIACPFSVWAQGAGQADQKASTGQGGAATDMENIEATVKQLSESVKQAAERFNQAVNTTPSQRLARLDAVIASINASVKECSPSGEMHINLSKAIEISEQKQKSYEAKSKDPKISGRTRERYANLARKFGSNMSLLYDKRMLLDKTRSDLEQRVKDLAEDKEFASDLIQAGEIEAANESLAAVVGNITAVTDAINQFAERLSAEGEETKPEEQ